MVFVTNFTLDKAVLDTILSLFQIPSKVLNNNMIHGTAISISENFCQEDNNVQFDNFGIWIQYYSTTNRIETTIIFPKFESNRFQLNLEVMKELSNLFSWFMCSRQHSNPCNNLFIILVMFVKLHQSL